MLKPFTGLDSLENLNGEQLIQGIESCCAFKLYFLYFLLALCQKDQIPSHLPISPSPHLRISPSEIYPILFNPMQLQSQESGYSRTNSSGWHEINMKKCRQVLSQMLRFLT